MNTKAIPLLLAALCLVAQPARAQSPVSFERQEATLHLRIHGKPFASYIWQDGTILRPYLAQVHAPNGKQVTRHHPPVAGKDASDHAAMHPGIWLAFGDLAGADFWRNKARVEHVEFVEKPKTTRDGGRFAVKNRYRAGAKTVCEEVCRISIRVRPNSYLIDWTSEFTGTEDFAFGDQEEMGLGVRMATPLTVKNGGEMRNSNGSKNEKQIWGKQADWCDYRGTIEGQPVGITLMTDRKNFRRSWFHARDYGLLVANPFGQNAFTKGEKSKVVVRKGQKLRLRFAILVYSGQVDVGAVYKEWLQALPGVEVSEDKKGFVLDANGERFVPWGFNYDHDEKGRLIEDYWEGEWPKIEADFAEMKKLGANVVRVHLQFGKFMHGPDRANEKTLDQLTKLIRLAESTGLYLNLTGLGCYHKKDVPAWYDRLTEQQRWNAQACFWEAVAARGANSWAIFCYDLMNEPVVPGRRRKEGEWLGPAFAGKHFVQFISLDPKGRARPDIGRAWIEHLVTSIRKVDKRHLLTVGLVDWSLERKGLTSGLVPAKVTGQLDFVSLHLYPETGKLDEAAKTLQGFWVGKPVVVEETFPLKCSPKELDEFIGRVGSDAAGWFSFYWGKPPNELAKSKQIGDALLLQWLQRFERRAKTIGN